MTWKLQMKLHKKAITRAIESRDPIDIVLSLDRSPMRVTVSGSVVPWGEIVPLLFSSLESPTSCVSKETNRQ